MNGIRLEVEAHIVLASIPYLKNLKKCLDDIGINVHSLVYSGLATAKATLTETEKELGVALVDIGGGITTITIFNEGSPSFASVIPIGANNVTNDLAIGLRFSLEDAEKTKIKLGSISQNSKFEDEVDLSQFGIISDDHQRKISIQTAINGIVKPRLEEIISLVYEQIQNSGLSQTIPAGIVLTGGGSQTVQIKEACAKIIPLPLRIAQPPKIGGITDDILNPAYTSSVGILLYDLEDHTQKFRPVSNKISFNNLFGRIKNFLEPLLP
jgi:cell division protein FtsA